MKRILISIFVGSALFSSPAMAQGWDDWGNSFSHGEARDAREEGKIVPLRKIFRELKREYGGYQLDAELFSRPSGDGSVYKIAWITEDGRTMRFVVDAQSGDIIRASGG